MAKEIKLTQGKVAVVDDEDYERISLYKWHANVDAWGNWYAKRRASSPSRATLLMHRVIVDAPRGIGVDHRDGDGLNNQRFNLRTATDAQNQRNRGKTRSNVSGYKGVVRYGTRWVAQIWCARQYFYLGRFGDPVSAAKIYDAKALELHGEFARLNFPE